MNPLSWTAEFVLTIFEWAGLVTATASVLFLYGALKAGKVVNDRQAEKILTLENKNLALQDRVEQEQREREEFEQSQQPRSLPFSTEDKFLQAFPGTEVVIEFVPKEEPSDFAGNIVGVVNSSGWKFLPPATPNDRLPQGVTMLVRWDTIRNDKGLVIDAPQPSRPAAEALIALLSKYGVESHVNGTTKWPSGLSESAIVVRVGEKSNARLMIRRTEELLKRTQNPAMQQMLEQSIERMKEREQNPSGESPRR